MRAKGGHRALGNTRHCVGSMCKEYAGTTVAGDTATEAGKDTEVDPMTRALNSEN